MIRPAIRRRAETSMATDAVAVPFTVGPGIRLPGTLRGASETLSTTPSDREGMAGHSQSRVNDAELIREAQRGNHAAFEQLVRQYDGPVLRLAYHMTRRTFTRKPFSRPTGTSAASGSSARFTPGFIASSPTCVSITCASGR